MSATERNYSRRRVSARQEDLLACCRTQIGAATVTLLILLRISLGWHFLYAGLEKLNSPNFTSAGFLGQAKGPLADKFHELVPDWEGRERLKPEYYLGKLKNYAAEFEQFYHPSEEQKAAIDQSLKIRSAAIEDFLKENKTEIDTYFHDWQRLDDAQKQASSDVPFQQKRNWDKQTALRGQLAVWNGKLEGTWTDFQDDLDKIRTPEQIAKGRIPQPVAALFTQDNIITYSNIAIGACLIAGLFTRLASLGGGLFLLSIVLAQPDWPGLYPAPPPSAGRTFIVNKEFIEMVAMFLLATTHVGRWGGLDFFIHYLFVRPFSGRKEPV